MSSSSSLNSTQSFETKNSEKNNPQKKKSKNPSLSIKNSNLNNLTNKDPH